MTFYYPKSLTQEHLAEGNHHNRGSFGLYEDRGETFK